MKLSEFDSDFEKYMFGSFRRKPEEDTDYEDEVFSSLEHYMTTGYKSEVFSLHMKRLLTLKSEYPDVLNPKAKTFYRGFRMPSVQFKKMNWIMVNSNWIACHGLYTPLNDVESWTSRMSVALNFAVFGADESYNDNLNTPEIIKVGWRAIGNINKGGDALEWVPAVGVTTDQENIIFNGTFMNKLSNQIIGDKEFEHLRIKESPTNIHYIMPISWYTKIKRILD